MERSSRVTLLTLTTAAVVLAVAGGGCQQGLNRNPNPGPGVSLDTLGPTRDFYARQDAEKGVAQSSLKGLSRDNWSTTQFAVPVAKVEHRQIYTVDKPHRATDTARQRGEAPTQSTVVEGGSQDSVNQQALEGLLAPVRASWDVVWMLPKMFVTPPWRVVSSPREWYERGAHLDASKNGGLRSAGLGARLQPVSPATTVTQQAAPTPQPEAGTVPAPTQPTPAPSQPAPSTEKPATATPPAAPTNPPPRGPGGAFSGSDAPKNKQPKKPEGPAPAGGKP